MQRVPERVLGDRGGTDLAIAETAQARSASTGGAIQTFVRCTIRVTNASPADACDVVFRESFSLEGGGALAGAPWRDSRRMA